MAAQICIWYKHTFYSFQINTGLGRPVFCRTQQGANVAERRPCQSVIVLTRAEGVLRWVGAQMKVFWQKGKWRMKVNCGGNHDNSNYSRNCCCWTRSVQNNPGRERHADSEKVLTRVTFRMWRTYMSLQRHATLEEVKRKCRFWRRAGVRLYQVIFTRIPILHFFLSKCHHTAALSNSPHRLREAITAARWW